MARKPNVKMLAIAAPESKDAAAADIKKIGDLQRDLKRIENDMNDQLAQIAQDNQPEIAKIQAQISLLQQGVHAYCQANRKALTEGNKTKTVNLVTGEVAWRIKPPSVTISKKDETLERIKSLGLVEFIRTEESINKEAILDNPAAAEGVTGIKIKSGIEQFTITPFEQEI